MTPSGADASCTSWYAGDVLLVALSGRIAGPEGAALLDWLPVTRPGRSPHVVVNLRAVTSIDRAGADSLVDACLATALRHGILALAGPTDTVYDSLRRFGVFRTVEVFADEEVAVGAVAQQHASAVRDLRQGSAPRGADIIDRGSQGREQDSPHESPEDRPTGRVR